MKRIIVLALALAVASAAFAQWTSGGYRDTGYGSRGASYQAGGAPAGWDTVVVVFTTETLADSSGTNLFAISTSTQVAADVERVYRLNDVILGRLPGGVVGCPVDTIHKLGTGNKVTRFAWANLDSANRDGYKAPNGTTIQLWSQANLSILVRTAGGTYANKAFANLNIPQTNRKIELVYIPWEKYIPANSTIVSADINISWSVASNYSVMDSVIAVQMSNPTDDKWYLVKNVSANAPNYSHASWAFQEDTNADNTPALTWTGTQRYPWVPAICNRRNPWDWGRVSDWSGNTATTVAEKSAYKIAITNCVQAVVNGAVNNGIMIAYYEGGTENAPAHFQWDQGPAAANRRTPVVTVKYLTRRYQKPFGSAEWAFVFQSDDGKYNANKGWTDTLATYGGKMTLYVAHVQLGVTGVNDATRGSSVQELKAFHDAGNEIGSHSKWHDFTREYPKRMNSGAVGAARTLTTQLTGANDGHHNIGTAAYDSMMVDFSPAWMYHVADSLGYDMLASPRWGKSFGVSTYQLGAYGQKALIDNGWKSIRSLTDGLNYDREKYYATPLPAYANNADSTMSGAPTQYGRHKRNTKFNAPWDNVEYLVGPATSLSATYATHLDSVANNMDRLVFQRIGNNTRALVMFSHDIKTGGTGFYTASMIDPDELGELGRAVIRLGGRFMTSGELAEWYAAYGTAVDHPFNAARSDTFDVEATDRVWFKPDGVDNRWIRGVK